MKSRNVITLILIVVICTGLTIVGCSDNKGDILKQVSGQWQNTQDSSQVKIQLTGDSKSITVKGQTYPVTVDSVCDRQRNGPRAVGVTAPATAACGPSGDRAGRIV